MVKWRILAEILALSLPVWACSQGDLQTADTDTGGNNGPPPALSVRAVLDASDQGLGTSLGWGAGVPSATVRVHRTEDPYDASYWTNATTDSKGVAAFQDLLEGLYEVEITRTLSSGEVSQAGGGAPVVAGGQRIEVPVSSTADVTLRRSRRGTLVFSELSLFPLPITATGDAYYDGKYFEIYNNSSSTVYLDGMLLGIGWLWTRDYSWGSCADLAHLRNDPGGIWSERILRFPGSGHEHPVAPGGVVVVAKGAIDHSQIDAGMPDLSHADFEFLAYGGADNPDVPNMEDVGTSPLPNFWPTGDSPFYLASPVDLGTLPRQVFDRDGSIWLRIPAAAVLDAVVNVDDFTKSSYSATPKCSEELNSAFERLPGPALYVDNQLYSAQRRVLTIDGQSALEDTNTSMVDFVRALATPGVIPGTGGGG